jgi:hypothetical protein
VFGQDYRVDRYSRSVYRRAALGTRTGPLAAFEPHCETERAPTQPALDVDGSRVAFVRETCQHERATAHAVMIQDVNTGVQSAGPATATSEVRMAGRYIAYRPAEHPDQIAVYDLDTSQVVKTIPGASARFDVQADGKLAEGPAPGETFTPCTRGVRWHAIDDPAEHVIAGCDSALIAIDGDHIGLWRQSPRGAAIATLDGAAREVNVPGTLAFEPELSGNRMVFSTTGCSRDTGAVWLDDGTDSSTLIPELPECRARPPQGTLKVDRKGRVAVPVSCPTGCRGGIEVTAGRRYADLIGLADFFEVPARKSRRISIDVGDLPKQFKRRGSILVRVEIRVNARDGGYGYTRTVRVLRMKL